VISQPSDNEVADFAVSLLLRYFSRSVGAQVGAPDLALKRDLELLKLHWALSTGVGALSKHCLENRHEIQSTLETRKRIDDGVIRGRLDAFATVAYRRVSGLQTAVVSHEPNRTYDSGPNQVLGWVIQQSWALATKFYSLAPDESGYQHRIDETLKRLEQVRKLQAITEIIDSSRSTNRPLGGALVSAQRSRKKVYRLAYAAYQDFVSIERGDLGAIALMLRSTLLGPLEIWRTFELAVGLAVGNALAAASGERLVLNLLIGDVRRPFATVGRWHLYWQWPTNYYHPPELEPSARIAQEVLDEFGLFGSGDRPDFVLVDRLTDRVVAIVEAKYLSGDDASDRIRSAVGQLVRYARGYRPIGDVRSLLGQSVISVSQGLTDLALPTPSPGKAPTVVDLAGLKRGDLTPWASRLL
jgi:hypothetical protein